MEPASVVSRVSLPENLRPKQVEVIEAFLHKTQVIAKLPVGYGKTLAAVGSYAVLRHRCVANRCLYVVPRRSQARQAADEVPGLLGKLFGVKTSAFIVGDHPIQAINANRRGTSEIFIATVQSCITPSGISALQELMSTGQWFVVIDEHHHYSGEEDSRWTDCIRKLPRAALLAMSATPNRRDGADHFPMPDISETYYDAAEQNYVKRMTLHAYQYTIDAVTIDGRTIPFTTAELAQEAGSESPDAIDQYLASRQMRWSPQYISPLIQFPLGRIVDIRATENVRTQMLIQAMSCSHASMVCEQVRALIPSYMRVDWVGTGPYGRPDDENDEILNQFCPPKDPLTGKREWTLDILVNVGMAGEGMDSTDVTEVVFLTPGNITTSNLQIMGRGARVMQLETQPFCHINVDTSAPLYGEGEYIGQQVMQLFDEEVKIPKEKEGAQPEPDGLDYRELPDDFQIISVDVRLIEIREEPMFKALVDDVAAEHPHIEREKVEASCENWMRAYLSRGNNESAIIAQKRQQVEAALVKIVGLALRRMSHGERIDRQRAGEVKKLINSKKRSALGPIEEAAHDQLRDHLRWLKNLEQHMLTMGLPSWLR